MIYREHYISQVREFYDSDLIKIITRVRRSGKSIILGQIKDEICKTLRLDNNSVFITGSNSKLLLLMMILIIRQEL